MVNQDGGYRLQVRPQADDLTRTISNKMRMSFSDSPRYLELRLDEDTLKNDVWHSVATALASIVLPVPGGPKISTPLQQQRKANEYDYWLTYHVFTYMLLELLEQLRVLGFS